MTKDAERPRLPIGRIWDLVAVNAVLVGAAFWAAAAWAARLPARYPVHWNLRGEPDRWSTAGGAEWYVMPILAGVLALLLSGLAWLMPRIPLSLWNVPNKEVFLRLPPERQGPIVTFTMRFLLWLSALDTLLFVVIQWQMFESARRGTLGKAWIALGAVGAIYVGYMIWAIVALSRRIRAATATAGSPPA